MIIFLSVTRRLSWENDMLCFCLYHSINCYQALHRNSIFVMLYKACSQDFCRGSFYMPFCYTRFTNNFYWRDYNYTMQYSTVNFAEDNKNFSNESFIRKSSSKLLWTMNIAFHHLRKLICQSLLRRKLTRQWDTRQRPSSRLAWHIFQWKMPK